MSYALHPPTDNGSLLDCALALRNDNTDALSLDLSPWYKNPCFAAQSAAELGDAVEALRRILQHSAGPGGSPQSLQASWETLFTLGLRTKVLPCRPVPNPFPLDVRDGCSLLDALRKAWAESTVVEGYQWGDVESHIGESDSVSVTTRHRRMHSVPSILLLHLQRFDYDAGVQYVVPKRSRPVDVPLSINTVDLHLDYDVLLKHASYSLTGGMIHLSEETSQPGEEDGHYAALILRHGQWFLLDDERVRMVDQDEALSCLEGCVRKTDGNKEGSFSRAVLLVYDSAPEKTEALWQEEEKNNQPVVGRRISVRWKSGRYFSGTVTSYNAETKKHTVVYDDGDVREYNLATKTYTWIHDEESNS